MQPEPTATGVEEGGGDSGRERRRVSPGGRTSRVDRGRPRLGSGWLRYHPWEDFPGPSWFYAVSRVSPSFPDGIFQTKLIHSFYNIYWMPTLCQAWFYLLLIKVSSQAYTAMRETENKYMMWQMVFTGQEEKQVRSRGQSDVVEAGCRFRLWAPHLLEQYGGCHIRHSERDLQWHQGSVPGVCHGSDESSS